MKMCLNVIVSILLISLFLFCSTDKQNEDNHIESNLHTELHEAISLVIDHASEKMKSDKYFHDNYYLVRFFEYKNVEYVTIGVLGNFPVMCTQFKDKSLYYDYDFNLMYYFNVNGKNVILMDYPKNAVNPFFKKSKNRNKIIPIIKNFDTTKPLAGFKMPILVTFVVCNKDDNPKLKLNQEIILSPAYPSEVGLKNIEIEDVN